MAFDTFLPSGFLGMMMSDPAKLAQLAEIADPSPVLLALQQATKNVTPPMTPTSAAAGLPLYANDQLKEGTWQQMLNPQQVKPPQKRMAGGGPLDALGQQAMSQLFAQMLQPQAPVASGGIPAKPQVPQMQMASLPQRRPMLSLAELLKGGV